MPLFRNPGRIVAMLVLAGFCLVAAPARAGDEEKALAKAVELFAEGDYLTAQEILVGIDRSKLNKRDQQTRDDYLNRVHVAGLATVSLTGADYVPALSEWAVSAGSGEKRHEYNLDAPPVFDGMAAADGSLYLVTMDGRVSCWRKP